MGTQRLKKISATVLQQSAVNCPLESVRRYSGASWVDLGCRLGNVPGGLTVHPKLEAVDKGTRESGFASEESTWLVLPLNVTGASPAEQGYGDGVGFSLGGGWSFLKLSQGLSSAPALGVCWHLNVTGLGFAPPPGQGSEAFVEVSVCGRLCEVVAGSYSWVECIMPNVTTPEVLEGVSDAVAGGQDGSGLLSPTDGARPKVPRMPHPSPRQVFEFRRGASRQLGANRRTEEAQGAAASQEVRFWGADGDCSYVNFFKPVLPRC
eukprot:s1238_g4.t1